MCDLVFGRCQRRADTISIFFCRKNKEFVYLSFPSRESCQNSICHLIWINSNLAHHTTLLTASHRTFSISCCDPKNVRTRNCHAVLHIRTHSSPSNCHPQIRYLDSQSNAMQINKIYLPNKWNNCTDKLEVSLAFYTHTAYEYICWLLSHLPYRFVWIDVIVSESFP